jgi:hypothetical protein
MPPELERLLSELLGSVADHNAAIAAGRISVDDWALLVARDLLAGHYAGYMVGRGTKDIGTSKATIDEIVQGQLDYLNKFADQLRAEGWRDAFGARAALYIGNVKGTFWRGRSFGIDLGFWPGDGGSPCLGNCRCVLEYDWIDEENLDVDIYWKLGAEQHCSVCPDRAANSPYKFREGERI